MIRRCHHGHPGHVHGRKSREKLIPASTGHFISKARALLRASSNVFSIFLAITTTQDHSCYTEDCKIKYLARGKRRVITELKQMWFFSWVMADYLPLVKMSMKVGNGSLAQLLIHTICLWLNSWTSPGSRHQVPLPTPYSLSSQHISSSPVEVLVCRILSCLSVEVSLHWVGTLAGQQSPAAWWDCIVRYKHAQHPHLHLEIHGSFPLPVGKGAII